MNLGVMLSWSTILTLTLFSIKCCGHSLLGEPRPVSARPCRLGGIPATGGLMDCPGPCDVSSLQHGFPVVTSPTNPSAVYKRGEKITLKYQRNNHGPGGFIRHTLVPLEKMMNKKAHATNAFQYTCWGTHSARAARSELGRDKGGFSLVGGDGKLHDGPIGYYTTDLTIPPVVPDGVYVLGWVWYGGVGGSMKGNTLETPYHTGLFADYWSCAFVEIKGGAELVDRYTPVFETGLTGEWADACNSMNDVPGVCNFEPCLEETKFMRPRQFKDGAVPDDLTPDLFESKLKGDFVVPTPVPEEDTITSALEELDACEKELGMKSQNVQKDKLKSILIALYQCKKVTEKEKEMADMPLFEEMDEEMPSMDDSPYSV